MRVCHLIHALGAGGAEQVLVDLARASGEVQMSVLALVDVDEPVHAAALRDAGVTVRSLGLRSRWSPRALSRAARAAGDLRPDVLHAHMKHADLVGAFVARRRRVPLVSTLHVIEDRPGFLDAGKRWLAGRARQAVAARTIAVSEAQRQWYLSAFHADPARVVTVHNGVEAASRIDDVHRTDLRTTLGARTGDLLAVNVSIMRPGKGHEDLLAAALLLPDDCPVRIALVGDGPERSRLEAQVAADARLADRVRFVGYRTDVPAVLQAADLVVHPSHAEALPTVLIHALAEGTPIVATNVGGVAEVVGDDSGVLVPPRAPHGLAAVVADLARAPARRARLATSGRARFRAEFDARLWARRLESLYATVREEAGSGGTTIPTS